MVSLLIWVYVSVVHLGPNITTCSKVLYFRGVQAHVLSDTVEEILCILDINLSIGLIQPVLYSK